MRPEALRSKRIRLNALGKRAVYQQSHGLRQIIRTTLKNLPSIQASRYLCTQREKTPIFLDNQWITQSSSPKRWVHLSTKQRKRAWCDNIDDAVIVDVIFVIL